jgi:hypothetical protein
VGQIIGSVIRHLVTAFGGHLFANGSEMESFIGAAITVVSIALSIGMKVVAARQEKAK